MNSKVVLTGVYPVVGPLVGVEAGLALRDLALVVRELEVETAEVDVQTFTEHSTAITSTDRFFD